jgi:hypothetical protein
VARQTAQREYLFEGLGFFAASLRDVAPVREFPRRSRKAVAQGTGPRGREFGHHLRTNVKEEAGVWRADAVYTDTPALLHGVHIIDANVVAVSCAEIGNSDGVRTNG